MAAADRHGAPTGLEDSQFEASSLPGPSQRQVVVRWMGWRLRLLVAGALIGCVGLFALLRMLADSPTLDARWTTDPQGRLVLVGSSLPALRGMEGLALVSVGDGLAPPLRVDAAALPRSGRWMLDDAERMRHASMQEALASRLQADRIELVFETGAPVVVEPAPRGWRGLGLATWPLAALGLVMYLVGLVVVLARPEPRNLLYALMTAAQGGNLVCIAVESMPGLGAPVGWATMDPLLRMALDGLTAAAVFHAVLLHPQRLPAAAGLAALAWATWGLVQLTAWTGALHDVWWWTQGLLLGLGLAGLAAIALGNRHQPHPFRIVMFRLGAAAWITLALATLAVVLAGSQPAMSREIALVGSLAWTVFFASVLLLFPFLSRSRQVWREFALLAGIATVAASLHLLFVSLFSLGELASLLLAALVAAAAYGAGRHWVMDRLLGRARPSTERVFEQLYRVARELQLQPHRHTELLTQLLRDLFEPLHAQRLQRATSRARVASDGSALLVPLQDTKGQGQALLLRFASRGQRIFTREDVRLAEVVVEQLRRAAAYDAAVEQGRSEERARIAQDLHDDIGARLLTLMYQAQSPEMEDYIRHTLQDLKTLTRGLAAAQHRLSHAAAEWKADLGQRLSAASIDLVWHFSTDEDFELGVVHWSALTRVLRELVSNAIAHAHCTRLEVSFTVEGRALTLWVADDGDGSAPQTWSHGLGLGGVRKRVKQLGGRVTWKQRDTGGIVCEVHAAELGLR